MSGSVRVLSLPGMATHVVAPAVESFRRQHPKVTIERFERTKEFVAHCPAGTPSERGRMRYSSPGLMGIGNLPVRRRCA